MPEAESTLPKFRPRLPVGLALAVGLALWPLPCAGDGWPGYLHVPQAVPEAWPEVPGALTKVWSRPLGPSYSSPVSGDGKVFVTFSRGESDVLAAFGLEDGRELWSLDLGPRYRGHDGSDDGPLSTPWVAGDRVVAISAVGLAVAAAFDGRELWRHDLLGGAETPFYGVASSPQGVEAGVLVQAPGRAAARLLRSADGSEAATFGPPGVTYQSPSARTLAGVPQVLVTTDRRLEGWGVDGSGPLWSFEHKEKGAHESAHPVPVGDDRLLLVLGRESVMLRLVSSPASGAGPALQVEEVWRAGVFKSSDARPVAFGDVLYGFSGNIMTAVSAVDGSLLWRSREMSGNNLSAVPGYLVQLGRGGELVLGRVTPQALDVVARLEVFDDGDYGNPAVVGDLIVVRNQKELAAVRVVAAPPVTGTSPPTVSPDPSGVE